MARMGADELAIELAEQNKLDEQLEDSERER